MKLSLMAAVAQNGVIGNGPDIPFNALGEQLLFKAMTFNQWLIVGRKTFESMGNLPNRKYAVTSRQAIVSNDPNVRYFQSIDAALEFLKQTTEHAFVAGGGQIYHELIDQADTLHISTVHQEVNGDVYFPEIPSFFVPVFEQQFKSNLDYTYQIYQRLKRDL